MSYIPDCRTDENYNFDALNEKDQEYVRGYDWAVACAVDNFFDNLEVYFDDDSYVSHFLDEKLPESMRESYTVFDFTGESSDREIDTYGDLIRMNLLNWVENHRDELITSMIDSYCGE